MGRDINWPSGQIRRGTTAYRNGNKFYAKNYEAYRTGDGEEQFGKRIHLNKDGNIRRTLGCHKEVEDGTYAPYDYQLTKIVRVEPGDYVVYCLRYKNEHHSGIQLWVDYISDIRECKERPGVYYLFLQELDRYDFDDYSIYQMPPEEYWKDPSIPKLHKGIECVLKVPKRFKPQYSSYDYILK